MTLTPETADQDLVVFLNKVQATIIGDKSCDLLAVLDQLHTNALSMDGKGGLSTDQLVSISVMTCPKKSLYLIAELGCLASTPTFSSTIPCTEEIRV